MKIPRFAIVLVAIVSAVGVSAALGASHAATRAVTIKTGNSSLGRIIVDARGRTLYLFEKDTRRHSACSGACAAYWPPLLTHGKPGPRGLGRAFEFPGSPLFAERGE
jgi:predicted lipoprotein with Yx(FWY)xxD motif